MYFKSFLVLLFVCLVYSPGFYAQTLSADVRSRFDLPQSIEWVHTFKGVWQGFHPIEILLGFDGSTYHGTLHLESGDLLFNLQGYRQDGKAMIQEIDQTGRTSGYLILEISDGLMTGEWWSTDFQRSASISLRDETVIALRRFEPEVLVLSGAIDNSIVNLIIQREESNLLSGFYSTGNDGALHRLIGECEDVVCDKMRFDLNSPVSETQILQCTRQRGPTFGLRLSDTSMPAKEGRVSIQNRYPMQRMHYASYVGNMDCVYPVLSIPSFDIWLQNEMRRWNTMVRQHLDNLEKSTVTPGPDLRWSIQASAWIDFTLISPENLSGVITMYNPIHRVYDRLAFIFDVKSGKSQSIQEIGRKADFATILKTDAVARSDQDSGNPEYLAWLKGQDFSHIALTMTGFVLFTDFNPVFGDAFVTLNYDDYIGSMKRNTFVLDLEE